MRTTLADGTPAELAQPTSGAADGGLVLCPDIMGLRPLFDEMVCASLGVDGEGRLTGRLDRRPPTGEARALVLAQYAADNDLDLGESVAYADSTSDLPLLECVGFPVAVNPEARLAAVARRRGWHVEHWDKAGGRGRPVLPVGPLDHGVSRWWTRLEGMLDTLSAGSGAAGSGAPSTRSAGTGVR